MKRWLGLAAAVLGLMALAHRPAPACTLCAGGNPQMASTFRQDVDQAKMVLYGVLKNAKQFNGTAGTVDLHIDRVLKADPFLGDKKVLTLPRYVPADPKNPPRYLVFCDVFKGKVDPYRGIPVQSDGLVDYLKGAIGLDPKDRPAALLYFFRHLDSSDPDIANDAYLELAKATDQEIGQVAKRIDPEKLRKLIQDPQTPAGRLGLFCFMLGASGGDKDAEFLRGLVDKPAGRTAGAVDGALAGYIQLRPKEGWELAGRILKDSKRELPERLLALGTIRFYHGWKGQDVDADVLRALGGMLEDTTVADMAVEDLRRWKLWDHTGAVLGLWTRQGFDAPVARRSVVRYALTCPKPEAGRFLEQLRGTKDGKELVKDVEESLQFEKMK
jgi:hypothetical protein